MNKTREIEEPVLAFITKDSKTKMDHAPVSLWDVLESTLQIPYSDMILIDDSEDETPKVFENFTRKHGKTLLIKTGAGTRARARQMAIDTFKREYSDEWILFVDDDVILNPGWWKEARAYMKDPDHGLLWGLNYDGTSDRPVWCKFLGVDPIELLRQEFWTRGGTHDTLIRREALDGCRIPGDLHVFEDWFLLNYVMNQGYEARIMDVGVTHYNPWYHGNPKTARLNAYLDVKYEVNCKRGSHAYRLYRFIRSTAGFPWRVAINIKAFGGREGLKRGLRRWITLFTYRIYSLIYGFKFPTKPEQKKGRFWIPPEKKEEKALHD